MTMQLAYRGVALLITDSTPQAMSHPALLKIADFRLFDIFPMSFLVFIGLVLVVQFILTRTQYGRNLYLVGGNINTADNLGLKANRYIWSAFILQGLFAAIAGVCLMTRTFSANGNIGSQSLLAVIPMVIVGGTSMGFYLTRKAWEDPQRRDAAVQLLYWLTSKESIRALGGTDLSGTLLESSYALLEHAGSMRKPLQDDMNRDAREAWLLSCVPEVAEGTMTAEECWQQVMELHAFEK